MHHFRHEFPLIFRSVLFMVCLTSLADHGGLLDWLDQLALKLAPSGTSEAAQQGSGLLDWLDQLALKLVPRGTSEAAQQGNGQHPHTIVLGLTSELFESHFGGHTPINRRQFTKLLRAVLHTYPNTKVLAVDYDLSPADYSNCARENYTGSPGSRAFDPGTAEDDGVCQIARIEKDQQHELDDFLKTDPLVKGPERRIVMIAPIADPDESRTPKPSESALVPLNWTAAQQKWMQDIKSNPNVQFADYRLLRGNLFATVLKYRLLPRPGGGYIPLAEAVNVALEKNRSTADFEDDAIANYAVPRQLINFGKASLSVFLCPLWEMTALASCLGESADFSNDNISGCPDMQPAAEQGHAQRPPPRCEVKVVFVGDLYGQEDRFLTPAGDMYGVHIHAYNAFSEVCPVSELNKIEAFLIDCLIGLCSAFTFQTLWGKVAASQRYSGARFFWIFGAFTFLGIVSGLLIVCALPWMMRRGYWLNPVVIVAALFVDMYAGAVERIAKQRRGVPSLSPVMLGGPRGLSDFVGLCIRPVPVVRWPDGRRKLQIELIYQILMRIVVYWAVVIAALWLIGVAFVQENSNSKKGKQCYEYPSI